MKRGLKKIARRRLLCVGPALVKMAESTGARSSEFGARIEANIEAISEFPAHQPSQTDALNGKLLQSFLSRLSCGPSGTPDLPAAFRLGTAESCSGTESDLSDDEELDRALEARIAAKIAKEMEEAAKSGSASMVGEMAGLPGNSPEEAATEAASLSAIDSCTSASVEMLGGSTVAAEAPPQPTGPDPGTIQLADGDVRWIESARGKKRLDRSSVVVSVAARHEDGEPRVLKLYPLRTQDFALKNGGCLCLHPCIPELHREATTNAGGCELALIRAMCAKFNGRGVQVEPLAVDLQTNG